MTGALVGIGSSGDSAAATGRANQLEVLRWADRLGGWITPDIVAHAVWPRSLSITALKSAQALLRRTSQEGFLLARALPTRSKVYVLTRTGANLIGRKPATDWGRIKDGRWTPPSTYAHNLRAARLLVALSANGYEVRTSSECNRRYGATGRGEGSPKVPDGLFRIGNPSSQSAPWVWVETEAERKTGQNMRKLADVLYSISTDRGREYTRAEGATGEEINLRGVALLLPVPSRLDKNGHSIDHRTRIRHAIRAFANEVNWPDAKRVSIQVFTEADGNPWLWHRERDILDMGLWGGDNTQDAGWLSGELSPPGRGDPEKEEEEDIAALSLDPFAAAKAALSNISSRGVRELGHMEHQRNVARHRAKALASELAVAQKRAQIAEAKAAAAEQRTVDVEQRLKAGIYDAQVSKELEAKAKEKETKATQRASKAEQALAELRDSRTVKATEWFKKTLS